MVSENSLSESQNCNSCFRQAALIESQEICPVLSLGLNQHQEETFHWPQRALCQERLDSQLESASDCFPTPQTTALRAWLADEQHLQTYVPAAPRELLTASRTERVLNKPLIRNCLNPSE